MGLDMFIWGKQRLWGISDESEELQDKVSSLFPELGDAKVNVVEAEVAYWRKANAIHQWFVVECGEGEDNCKPYDVSREQLMELRDLCRQVILDPEKGEDILPTESGFFFGSTEYDEWYMEEVKATVELLDGILENPKFEFGGWDFEYRASW
jgi:hypothetical protein